MSDITDWIRDHATDYATALSRVAKARSLLLSAKPSTAGRTLKHAYVFAVLSIRTPLERHERAYSMWATGMPIEEAGASTVYGNQKAAWIRKTMNQTHWDSLALALQSHYNHGDEDVMLDVVADNLLGVSHRKGAFMLALSGMYEFICIDSNVARFAGLVESEGNALEFNSASDYFDSCRAITDSIDTTLPPFLTQWAIYDYQRGEHARHMAFYREVLPELQAE